MISLSQTEVRALFDWAYAHTDRLSRVNYARDLHAIATRYQAALSDDATTLLEIADWLMSAP